VYLFKDSVVLSCLLVDNIVTCMGELYNQWIEIHDNYVLKLLAIWIDNVRDFI
jgi:hypothetical protein